MRYSCKASVEYDLKMHQELHSKYEEELARRREYKGLYLKVKHVKNGKKYYGVIRKGETKNLYAGGSKHPIVIGISEYAFYKKAIEVIEKNIDILEGFLAVYKRTSADHINELLPAIYTLPPDSKVLKMDSEIEAWLQKNKAIKNKYPVFDPAGLKITAFDGTLMRSRAEAFHHEAFYIYGIPDIYELPYEIGKNILRPDFTALDVYRMRPVIYEHLGNWFHSDQYKRERYRTDSIHRIDECLQIGFYPEATLFLTFGTDDNTFDIQSIHQKIAMLATPPPSKETMELLKRA